MITWQKKPSFSPLASIKRLVLWIEDIPKRFERNKNMHSAVEQLILNSSLEERFFVMCFLSGLMATIGLVLHDFVIIIGAMVLAPILNPILALSAGVMIQHKKLVTYAVKSLVGGILSVILITATFTKLLILLGVPLDFHFFQTKFATPHQSYFFFLASFLSGFAAVYAWLRSSNNLNLVGIAIAVSLIPFLSFLGMLFGAHMFELLQGYSIIFGLNIASLILGSMLAFVILGFSESNKRIDREIKEAEHQAI